MGYRMKSRICCALVLLVIFFTSSANASKITGSQKVSSFSFSAVNGYLRVRPQAYDWSATCNNGDSITEVTIPFFQDPDTIQKIQYNKLIATVLNAAFAKSAIYFEGDCANTQNGFEFHARRAAVANEPIAFDEVGKYQPPDNTSPIDSDPANNAPYLCEGPESNNLFPVKGTLNNVSLHKLICDPEQRPESLNFEVVIPDTIGFVQFDAANQQLQLQPMLYHDMESSIITVFAWDELYENRTAFQINIFPSYVPIDDIDAPTPIGGTVFEYDVSDNIHIGSRSLLDHAKVIKWELLYKGGNYFHESPDHAILDQLYGIAGTTTNKYFFFNKPSNSWGNTYWFELSATHFGYKKGSKFFGIRIVNKNNHPPEFLGDVSDIITSPGVLVDIDVSDHISDPDILDKGDIVRLSYVSNQLPKWIDRTKLEQEHRIYGIPTSKDIGSIETNLYLNDRGSLQAKSNTFRVTVLPFSEGDADNDGVSDMDEFYSLWRVSVDLSGGDANGESIESVISADGKFIAFSSTASNIVENDSNNASDVFLFSRIDKSIRLVSADISGHAGNGRSFTPSISANGRYISFISRATNLVANGSNNEESVFLFDAHSNQIEKVSINSNGEEASKNSNGASISSDGRYVVFSSMASDLSSGDDASSQDVFLRDLHRKTTRRITGPGTSGVQPFFGNSYEPSVSSGGEYVVFLTTSTNYFSGDTNGSPDVVLFDLANASYSLVSKNNRGFQAEHGVMLGKNAISADGRYVVFLSGSNLVSDYIQPAPFDQVYIYDRVTNSISLVSADAHGYPINSKCFEPSISPDGLYVSYSTANSSLTGLSTFRYSVSTGAVDVVSSDTDGVESSTNDNRVISSLSLNGRFVAFNSTSSSLILNDGNGVSDVYYADMLVRNLDPNIADSDGDGLLDGWEIDNLLDPTNYQDADADNDGDGLSNREEFDNLSNPNHADTDGDGWLDGYEYQHGSSLTDVDFTNIQPTSVKDLGRKIVIPGSIFNFDLSSEFTSENVVVSTIEPFPMPEWVSLSDLNKRGVISGIATDQDIGVSNWRVWVYVDDTIAELNFVLDVRDPNEPDIDGDQLSDKYESTKGIDISLDNGGIFQTGQYIPVDVSDDGLWAVFNTNVRLLPEDQNNYVDVYLRNTSTEELKLVSLNREGRAGNHNSYATDMTPDGRFVCVKSGAGDLVEGDTNYDNDIFVYDTKTGFVDVVSVSINGMIGNKGSRDCSISDNGNLVAFSSNSTNLVDFDYNTNTDVFVHDRSLSTTRLVSKNSSGYSATGYGISISPNGRYVAFSTPSSLLSHDTNGVTDVYRLDLETEQLNLISHRVDGGMSSKISSVGYRQAISNDGSKITFSSLGDLAGKTYFPQKEQVYVYLADTDSVMLISEGSDGAYSSWTNYSPTISTTGRYIFFGSSASNLIDGNSSGDYSYKYDFLSGSLSNLFYDELLNHRKALGPVSSNGFYALYQSGGIYNPVFFANLMIQGLDMENPDTDFDGIDDSFELANQLDPADSRDANLDYDGDGLSNIYEIINGFDLYLPDTDGDGLLDGSGLPSNYLLLDRTQINPVRIDVKYGAPVLYDLKVLSDNYFSSSDLRFSSVNDFPHWLLADSLAFEGELSGVPGYSDRGEYAIKIWVTEAAQPTKLIEINLIIGVWSDNPNDTDEDQLTNDFESKFQVPVSLSYSGGVQDGWSGDHSVSYDGRMVVFASTSTNLVEGDTNGVTDIFLYDYDLSRISMLSKQGSVGAQGTSSKPMISGDGSRVVFASLANNLVDGDTNNRSDIFLWTRDTGDITCLTLSMPDGSTGGADPVLSKDGRVLLYRSLQTNDFRILEIDSNIVSDIPKNLLNGNFYSSSNHAISGDGRYIAFWASTSQYYWNAQQWIYRYDRVLNQITKIAFSSVNSPRSIAYSDDGLHLAVKSPDIPSQSFEYENQVYLFHTAGGLTKVSKNNAGQMSNADSDKVSVSSNGDFIVYQSNGTNLAEGLKVNLNVFLYDRLANTTSLVGIDQDSNEPMDAVTSNPVISGNGRVVVYHKGSQLYLFDKWRKDLDPNNSDTDGDGLSDGWEINNGLNPIKPNVN